MRTGWQLRHRARRRPVVAARTARARGTATRPAARRPRRAAPRTPGRPGAGRAVAAVGVGRLVAALGVGVRGREVADGAVRVAGSTGSGRPGARSFTAMPISVNVSPGAVTITPSPMRTACTGPSRALGAVPGAISSAVRRAHLAWKPMPWRSAGPAPRATASRELRGVAVAQRRDLLRRRQRQQIGNDSRCSTAASGVCCDRLVLPAEQQHRDQRAVRPLHEVAWPGRAVGQRVHRLDRQPLAHAHGLRLVLAERAPRQHVAGRSLEEHALAADHPADRQAERGRVVAGVRGDVHACGDGVAAEADDGRDRGVVGTARLQRHHLAVEQAVGPPAVHDVAVGAALAAVDVDVDGARAPGDRRRLQPRGRLPRRRHHPVGEQPLVGVHVRVAVGLQQPAAAQEAAGGRRRAVRVVPVEQRARRIGAGRLRDAPAQGVDLRGGDAERVDAREHHARLAGLEHQHRDLERQPHVEERLLAAHEPESRQAQARRRRERGCGGPRAQRAGRRAHERRSRS